MLKGRNGNYFREERKAYHIDEIIKEWNKNRYKREIEFEEAMKSKK
jgi:hypothetical protein